MVCFEVHSLVWQVSRLASDLGLTPSQDIGERVAYSDTVWDEIRDPKIDPRTPHERGSNKVLLMVVSDVELFSMVWIAIVLGVHFIMYL